MNTPNQFTEWEALANGHVNGTGMPTGPGPEGVIQTIEPPVQEPAKPQEISPQRLYHNIRLELQRGNVLPDKDLRILAAMPFMYDPESDRAGGSLLYEGSNGQGKTRLGKHLAAIIGGVFKRVSGTDEVTSGDFTGTEVFDRVNNRYQTMPGKLAVAHVLLVDEANRIREKSTNGLLEGLEEGTITVGTFDEQTFKVPNPNITFFTENPYDDGTYPMSMALKDRINLSMISTRQPNIAILAKKEAMTQEPIRCKVPGGPEQLRRAAIDMTKTTVTTLEAKQRAENLSRAIVRVPGVMEASRAYQSGRTFQDVIRLAVVLASVDGKYNPETQEMDSASHIVTPDHINAAFPYVALHRIELAHRVPTSPQQVVQTVLQSADQLLNLG